MCVFFSYDLYKWQKYFIYFNSVPQWFHNTVDPFQVLVIVFFLKKSLWEWYLYVKSRFMNPFIVPTRGKKREAEETERCEGQI